MMPPNWGKIPDKPICRECACVEFGEDMVCLGCGEPLVVRPYPKKSAIHIIAAEKWGNHWPKDYENRCFLCGWKYRKTIDSLIPKDLEEYMAAGIRASRPEANRLSEIICPGRTLSERLKIIIGILATTGENALFKVSANKKYVKLAKNYKEKTLSFCRKCAEEDAIPKPAEVPVPTSVNLTKSLASTMIESKSMLKSIPIGKGPIDSSKLIDSTKTAKEFFSTSPNPKKNDNDWNWEDNNEDWLEEESNEENEYKEYEEENNKDETSCDDWGNW